MNLDEAFGPVTQQVPATPAPVPHPDDVFGPKVTPPAPKGKALVASFKFRPDSPRERFVALLVKRLGKPVKFAELAQAAFGDETASLDPMVAGVRWRIKMWDMPYVCSISNKTITLSKAQEGLAN